MPKCNTVLQSESDLFEPEISNFWPLFVQWNLYKWGSWDGEHFDKSPFPGYTCALRQNIMEYFCHLPVQTTKTVYLMTFYREYT